MIKLIGVNKAFGNHVLYQDLNLTIENGEFVVLTGASGCGKTTLLNMIGGIEPPDAGTILVDGMDIAKRKNKLNYFQTKLGVLFQNFALVENMSVRKNLELVQKRSRSNMTIEEALHRVGMEACAEKQVSEATDSQSRNRSDCETDL